jgi:hypothetical protein
VTVRKTTAILMVFLAMTRTAAAVLLVEGAMMASTMGDLAALVVAPMGTGTIDTKE